MDFSEQLHHLVTLDGLISLLTLTVLEIVLGIDNIIFVSIIAGKLSDRKDQRKARSIGLTLALVMRVLLLLGISWIISLKDPILTLFEHEFSGRDLILLAGGVFLLAKTTSEIHEKIEGGEGEKEVNVKKVVLSSIIFQIIFIDIIFSFDSILTAVGVVNNVTIMIAAVIISMLLMLAASEKVSDFINRHPTVKMLALAFLMMIGVLLVMEGFGKEVPKEYVYCSMAFAFFVELLNMRVRKKKGNG